MTQNKEHNILDYIANLGGTTKNVKDKIIHSLKVKGHTIQNHASARPPIMIVHAPNVETSSNTLDTSAVITMSRSKVMA